MTNANEAVVRSMYEARDRGDVEALLAHYSEDVVTDVTDGRVDAEVVHGREAMVALIGEWIAAFDDWREDIESVQAFGDQVCVAAIQYGVARETGAAVETRYGLVYEVRDGAIKRMTLYRGHDDALRAARGDS